MEFVDTYLEATVAAFLRLQSEPDHRDRLIAIAELITSRFRGGHKLLICGNGGSAADAQHIAGEFVVRLMFDRAPLPAIALTTDSSVLTATGNDYGYDMVFERQVLALGQEGDVLLGISTSGNSTNVLRAFSAARTKRMACIGFTGARRGQMQSCCDLLFEAPAADTAIVQQLHIAAAHVICAVVEQAMFSNEQPRQTTAYVDRLSTLSWLGLGAQDRTTSRLSRTASVSAMLANSQPCSMIQLSIWPGGGR